MKTLLFVLLTSCAAFSQIPRSGEKTDLKIEEQDLTGTLLLPSDTYKILEPLRKSALPEGRTKFEYEMPVKKVTSENYTMPIKNVESYDRMNAAFYFKQRQITVDDTKK